MTSYESDEPCERCGFPMNDQTAQYYCINRLKSWFALRGKPYPLIPFECPELSWPRAR